MTITNESSVSKFADRELRFVEPNMVKKGGLSLEGDSHMPAQYELPWRAREETNYLWRGRSNLVVPTLKE